jgi:hypothetical protein
VSLQANLLTVSSTSFPWVLLEVRADQTPPQARLAKSDGAIASEGAWFEPGDSPTSGWMLVRIGADFATVMSSHGHLVQLSVAATSSDALPENRTEH